MNTVEEIIHILDVTPKLQKWTVKVIVYEKTQPRVSNTGGTRHQMLVLVDDKGQKVMATKIWFSIDMFKDQFCVSATYIIRNAKVKALEDKYSKFNYPYQWTINKSTVFYEETASTISRSILKAHFTKFCDLQNTSTANKLIDILAIVIQKREPRSFVSYGKQHMVRDFAILNEEKKPVVLTLWNSVAESEGKLITDDNQQFPMISATALAYSPYYDGSLGSTPSTVIEVDPQIPTTQNLSTRRLNNIQIVSEMIGARNYFARDDSKAPISADVFHSIADIVADCKGDKFVVKVSVRINDPNQKKIYMGCQKCHSGINADLDYVYTCIACKEDTKASPREKVHLNIYDDSGSLDVTLFGDQSKQILEIDALQCMEHYNSGDALPVHEINNKLASKIFLAKLRRKERAICETYVSQYTVIRLQEEEDIRITQEFSKSEVASKSTHTASSSARPPEATTI